MINNARKALSYDIMKSGGEYETRKRRNKNG